MIGKLRRNFILVAMCSMAAVLVVIVGSLNLVSYFNMVTRADSLLELLAENGASFPAALGKFDPGEKLIDQSAVETMPEQRDDIEKGDIEKNDMGKHRTYFHMQEMSPETPFETRYFSVRLDREGQVLTVDTGKIAAVETEDAVAYAEEIRESGRHRGFYGSYRYKAVTEEDSVMILFVDRSRELASFRELVFASVSVSVLGLLAVFVLVVIFSKKVFRPVAVSYEKQKQFITDASHELKTPLTIISANVEVLEMEWEAEATAPVENTWLKSIQNQVTRLTALVEQMVTLSRMDENSDLQDSCDFSLSDAVQETAEFFCAPAEKKGLRLEMAVQDNCTYHGDERLIRQMVSLLMDNAVKYAPEGGLIQVNLSTKGKKYQLTVWNTAESIPQGKLDVLFERFYRLDSSRNSQTGGSGIGLSIVKSIVEAHKGKITASSEDGKSLQITAVL